jgi:integrase
MKTTKVELKKWATGWYIVWRQDGERITEKLPKDSTKEERNERFMAKTAELQKGVDSKAGRTPFEVYAKEYIADGVASGRIGERTAQTYKTQLSHCLMPSIGFMGVALADIDRPMIKRFRKKLPGAAGHSAATTNRVIQFVKAVLNEALVDRYITYNPCEKLGKLDHEKTEIQVLSFREADWLMHHAQDHHGDHDQIDPRYSMMIALGLYAGLRIGEVLGLQWKHINFFAQELQLKQQWSSQLRKLRPLKGGKKANKKNRDVDMDADLMQMLREYRMVMGNPDDEAFVFPATKGKANITPLDGSNFGNRAWMKIKKAAKVSEGFRFHDLRHTYASHLLESGARIDYVSKQLGHYDPSFTLSVYAHLLPDPEKQQVTKLTEARRAALKEAKDAKEQEGR